jgi:hypothetical protein
MTSASLQNARMWRMRAEETRALADDKAIDYDRLAGWAEKNLPDSPIYSPTLRRGI